MDFSSTIPKAVPALREWRLKLFTQREENKGYNHYLRPTFALPTPYLGRFMFGFRLKAKPEHEAAQVGSW